MHSIVMNAKRLIRMVRSQLYARQRTRRNESDVATSEVNRQQMRKAVLNGGCLLDRRVGPGGATGQETGRRINNGMARGEADSLSNPPNTSIRL